MADGGEDDEQQRAEATIDPIESRQVSYCDWGFERDYLV
jgi:hypothetical protein